VKLKKLTLSLGLGVLAFASASAARADIGGFGFGSRTAGLAGAGAAWGFDAYSAYANPAGLTEASGKKLRLSYGWIFMDPKFTPIRGVTVENGFTSDRTSTGDVPDNYRSVLGQTVGAAALLAPDWYHLSAGITIFTPFDPLGAIDTGEPYRPEYVLYRSRTQRPLLEAGVAAKLTQRLSVGLGLHVGYAITAKGNAFLQTKSGTTSSIRISASLKPKTSPNLAWLLVSETPQEEAGAWSFGQVLRTTHNAQATLNFDTSARAFGDLAALDIGFGANSALFYDPLSLETGFSWKHSPRGRIYLQADFQNWANFKRPALEIHDPAETCTPEPGETCDGPGGPLKVNPSVLPGMSLRNIVTPRIAEEISFEASTLRLGYAYRPTMFKGLPNEAGNYLDPSKHIVSAGWGWKFPTFLGWSAPAQLDVHASYQHIVSAKVLKTAGDESGKNPTGAKIGAPGYDIGGRLWGGGATLTLEL
jgi:long-subunit fatty acid transport protein